MDLSYASEHPETNEIYHVYTHIWLFIKKLLTRWLLTWI